MISEAVLLCSFKWYSGSDE